MQGCASAARVQCLVVLIAEQAAEPISALGWGVALHQEVQFQKLACVCSFVCVSASQLKRDAQLLPAALFDYSPPIPLRIICAAAAVEQDWGWGERRA